jgi:biotin carboxyl carrier protein
MKFRVVLEDGRPHEVEVRDEKGQLVVLVDGVAQRVELLPQENGDLLAVIDGRPYPFSIQREGEGFALDLPGGRTQASIEEEAVYAIRQAAAKRSAQEGKTGIFEVKSPIAGVVLALSVPEGATVTTGDALALVEAMKMENPIPAPRAGVVQKFMVKPGETLRAGQVLALLAPVGA